MSQQVSIAEDVLSDLESVSESESGEYDELNDDLDGIMRDLFLVSWIIRTIWKYLHGDSPFTL